MAWLRVGGTGRSALVPGEYKPDATTTGVSASATLTVYNGNYIFAADGEVAENLEIRGYVDFNAKSNCVLRNCKVIEQSPRATTALPVAFGVRQFGANATGTIVEDCTIYPATPGENHYYAFWGFLAGGIFRRNDVSGFIDGCNVSGTPGTIEANYFHDSSYWSPHPGWSDNMSHNDAIQMSNAIGWTIRGNTFAWPTNGTACILISDGAGLSNSNVIDRNWFDTGAVAINLAEKPGVGGQTITDNLAGERADFRTTIHLLASTTAIAASTISGNETYLGEPWFTYSNS